MWRICAGYLSIDKRYTPNHGCHSETQTIQAEMGVPCRQYRDKCGDDRDAVGLSLVGSPARGLQAFGVRPRRTYHGSSPSESPAPRRFLAHHISGHAVGMVAVLLTWSPWCLDGMRDTPVVPLASLGIDNAVAVPSRQATFARSLPRLRLRPDREYNRTMSGVRAGCVTVIPTIIWYTVLYEGASKTPSVQTEVVVPRRKHRGCNGDGRHVVRQSVVAHQL